MGRVDVDRMLSEITVRQLEEWKAYFAAEPWGCETEDYRTALLGSIVLNLVKGKSDRAVTPADLVPDRDGTRGQAEVLDVGELTAEEQQRVAAALAAALGGG